MDMAYSRVERLISEFRDLGVEPSDNLARSLEMGHTYAAKRDYVPATDTLLNGLLRSNNTLSSIASELTDKPDNFNQILESAIRRYRAQMFPTELTFHCSIGAPQYAKKMGYTNPAIGDSNAHIYRTMIQSAKGDGNKQLDNKDLYEALLKSMTFGFISNPLCCAYYAPIFFHHTKDYGKPRRCTMA